MSLSFLRSRSALAVLAALAALAILNLLSPALLIEAAPSCPFLQLTGLQCPFCGATRALSSLGRGRIGEAFLFNPLIVIAILAGAAFLAIRAATGGAAPTRWAAGWLPKAAAAGAIVIWWILRNTSGTG